MALTRKNLEEMGLTEEQVEAIIKGHSETVRNLKQEIVDAQADTEAVAKITKERDDALAKVEALEKASGDAAKVQAEFDAYKAEQVKKETTSAKYGALEAFLKEKAGVHRPSFVKAVMNAWGEDQIELAADGKTLKNQDAAKARVEKDFLDFVGTVQQVGTPATTPPPGNGTGAKTSRIAQIAAEYNRSHYGEQKE